MSKPMILHNGTAHSVIRSCAESSLKSSGTTMIGIWTKTVPSLPTRTNKAMTVGSYHSLRTSYGLIFSAKAMRGERNHGRTKEDRRERLCDSRNVTHVTSQVSTLSFHRTPQINVQTSGIKYSKSALIY